MWYEARAYTCFGAATALWVACGVKWADFDNDGRLDLALANGHVYDNAGQRHLGRGSGK